MDTFTGYEDTATRTLKITPRAAAFFDGLSDDAPSQGLRLRQKSDSY
jgi:hypothetical protein